MIVIILCMLYVLGMIGFIWLWVGDSLRRNYEEYEFKDRVTLGVVCSFLWPVPAVGYIYDKVLSYIWSKRKQLITDHHHGDPL